MNNIRKVIDENSDDESVDLEKFIEDLLDGAENYNDELNPNYSKRVRKSKERYKKPDKVKEHNENSRECSSKLSDNNSFLNFMTNYSKKSNDYLSSDYSSSEDESSYPSPTSLTSKRKDEQINELERQVRELKLNNDTLRSQLKLNGN